jgi:hypothetical protein
MNVIEWFRAGRVSRRTRVVLLASMVVVGTGVAIALGALWLDPARASVGPLPGHGLLLPADSRFVMGVDVKRLTASPFYARYAEQGMRPEALRELEEKTGLDPARDVDQIVVAGSPNDRQAGLALVLGRFDLYKLGRTLETEGKVRGYTHEGTTVYAFKDTASKAGVARATAVAFLGEDALLFGTRPQVEAAVASRSRGETPLRSNALLLGLVANVRPGSTFWMVGDQSLLSGLQGSGAAGSMMNLPALRSLTVVGDVDPQVSLSVTGEATDAPAAQKLADVVRGLVAMATLQAQQRPELQQLSSAITVATEANKVIVSARIPYALLDSLQAMTRPQPAPPREAPPATGPIK